MAEIPLRLLGWAYEEDENRVVAKFCDVPRDDDPDPVNFQPTRFFTIEWLPQSTDSEVRILALPPTPPPPPITTPPAEEPPGGAQADPTP